MIPSIIHFSPSTKQFTCYFVVCGTTFRSIIKFIVGTLYNVQLPQRYIDHIIDVLVLMVHMRLDTFKFSNNYQAMQDILINFGIPKYILDIVSLLPPKGEQKIGVLYCKFIVSTELEGKYNFILSEGFDLFTANCINLTNLLNAKNKSDLIVTYVNQLDLPSKVINITTLFTSKYIQGVNFELVNNSLAISEIPTLGLCTCIFFCLHIPIPVEYKSVVQMLSLNFESGSINHEYFNLILNDCLKWYYSGNSVILVKPKPVDPGPQKPSQPKQTGPKSPQKGGKPAGASQSPQKQKQEASGQTKAPTNPTSQEAKSSTDTKANFSKIKFNKISRNLFYLKILQKAYQYTLSKLILDYKVLFLVNISNKLNNSLFRTVFKNFYNVLHNTRKI
jgi:hypothetical protein